MKLKMNLNDSQFNEAPLIIREFLGYIGTIKGESPKTVSEYYLDLRTFFRYVKWKHGMVPADAEFEQIRIRQKRVLEKFQACVLSFII